MTDETVPQPQAARRRWQLLSAVDRRVVGVLVEKAKTTPDAYPMSLNAIVTACSQKSNRHPFMQIEADDVEASLDRLREVGAVGIVQGSGRVSKYRHYLYEWLGVDKVELAVMAELLLRGAQTEGELRARAARMEPIQDLAALRPVLASLKAKGLVVALTPEGRGHVVSHALYTPEEFDKVKAQYATGPTAPTLARADAAVPGAWAVEPSAPRVTSSPGGIFTTQELRAEMSEIRSQVQQLRGAVDELAASLQKTQEELERLRSELGT